MDTAVPLSFAQEVEPGKNTMAVLQLVILFCSDDVSYQCKSWSDIVQEWSDMH